MRYSSVACQRHTNAPPLALGEHPRGEKRRAEVTVGGRSPVVEVKCGGLRGPCAAGCKETDV